MSQKRVGQQEKTVAFGDLEFGPHHMGGVAARHTFANGYTASVVRFYGSYGYEDGLYEAAVIHDGSLVYDTSVTNDVIGHLSEDGVTDVLARIAALPAREQVRA